MTSFFNKNPKEPHQNVDRLSVTVALGEKDMLNEALNNASHNFSSLNRFMRSAINDKLKSMKIKFQLTE